MRFRRYYVPNSIVFITQVVEGREAIFADKANLDLLRSVLHVVKELHPFAMVGYVFLPDHAFSQAQLHKSLQAAIGHRRQHEVLAETFLGSCHPG